MQTGKRLWALMCCMLMIFLPTAQAAQPLESGTPMTLTTPSAILAETATGTVIFEKNADERREVASITKLMTALLVLEALDRDEIALTDSVQISPRAAAMKGSQALLDASAVYPLEDLLRTTIMASANDSAVALSEYIAGSEENFVDRMNRRAAELGMTNTNYVNCTGYPQSGQYTTARDVCRLCCEIAKHPRYNQYASVWIDKLTHPGGRVTDLTNTNRLVRFYEGCDGLQDGFDRRGKILSRGDGGEKRDAPCCHRAGDAREPDAVQRSAADAGLRLRDISPGGDCEQGRFAGAKCRGSRAAARRAFRWRWGAGFRCC